MRILLVGQRENTHIGGSFARAAEREGHEALFADTRAAYAGGPLVAKLKWHLAGRLPARLAAFSRAVSAQGLAARTELVLTTGLAPVRAAELEELTRRGIVVANFLTDDPWNPAHRASWFFEALRRYSGVFSPRRANLEDLRALGVPNVHYLPFGYDEELFFPDAPAGAASESDVIFAGGADPDRVPYIAALLEAGVNVALYGGYWDRYAATRGRSRGIADVAALRRAMSRSRIGLCLVRRKNRDGTSMRSFEVPAVGACMLAEDTPEHRETFGPDGEAVVYFRTPAEMVEKTRRLLTDDAERIRLADAAHRLMTGGQHTYRDRLKTMLTCASAWK